MALHRSTKRRPSGSRDRVELIQRLQTLSERYPRFGYRKSSHLLKAEQWGVNRETVRRIRKHAGLQVIQTAPKRRPVGESPTTPTRVASPHHVWRYDVVHDETPAGRRRQGLPVLDAYTRAGLPIHGARSITAEDVVQVWQRLVVQRRAPGYIKSENGPACMAQRVTTWRRGQRVDPHCIAPGSPWQNGHHERLNGVFRDGGLKRWLCTSVQEARRIITHWLEEYNHARPHGALEGLTPHAFAAQGSPPCLGRAA